MSNINNLGVGMNIIDFSSHLQELSCEEAAAIQGGITFFEDANFEGQSLNLGPGAVVPDLRDPSLNTNLDNQISSLVNAEFGTSYQLCRDINFGGGCTVIPPRTSISFLEEFANNVSSIKDASV